MNKQQKIDLINQQIFEQSPNYKKYYKALQEALRLCKTGKDKNIFTKIIINKSTRYATPKALREFQSRTLISRTDINNILELFEQLSNSFKQGNIKIKLQNCNYTINAEPVNLFQVSNRIAKLKASNFK